MSRHIPTIGLEIHAELKTQTKMFCDCPNDPNEKHPNTNVCPVCLGHPGTLPTINKEAVRQLIRVGLALGGKINPTSKFDRKNYFYPDLPKGYQISQYDQPIVVGGNLNGVRLTRIHLEEDAARSQHISEKSGGKNHGGTATLVDFNRASAPLMELVTEPDIKSAEQAVAFAKELQLILRYLGASDADMEKGQMRLEANVSLGTHSTDSTNSPQASSGQARLVYGTKVEVKNINSFKALGFTIEYELARQEEVLEKGEKIKQETRGWDDVHLKTVSQRSKEGAHDYRYFPEPDLPPFETNVFNPEKLAYELPELPKAKRERFAREFGLNEKQIDALVSAPQLADFFEEAVSEAMSILPRRDELRRAEEPHQEHSAINAIYNYLTSDLAGILNDSGAPFKELKITPEHLAHLITLIHQEKIESRQAKVILKKMFDTGVDPEEILMTENLATIYDEGELEKVVASVIQENEQAVQDYKKGKEAALQFMIGKAMGKLRGRARPNVLKELLTKKLS